MLQPDVLLRRAAEGDRVGGRHMADRCLQLQFEIQDLRDPGGPFQVAELQRISLMAMKGQGEAGIRQWGSQLQEAGGI